MCRAASIGCFCQSWQRGAHQLCSMCNRHLLMRERTDLRAPWDVAMPGMAKVYQACELKKCKRWKLRNMFKSSERSSWVGTKCHVPSLASTFMSFPPLINQMCYEGAEGRASHTDTLLGATGACQGALSSRKGVRRHHGLQSKGLQGASRKNQGEDI